MSDNPNYPPQDDDPNEDISPSTLFLEMMRQAARETDKPQADALPIQQPEPIPLEPLPPQQPLAQVPFQPEEPAPTAPAPQTSAQPPEPQAPTAPEPEPNIVHSRVPIYTAPEEAPTENDQEAQREAQRIRRIKRRQERRRRRRVGAIGGFLRTAFIAFFAAALASTIFTWFTDPEFLNPEVASGLQVAESTSIAAIAPPTATQLAVTPNWLRRIGIVSGHRGNDSGAVCDDGLTEAEINFAVSQLVVQSLRSQGYTVDLLDEFDPRLDNYQATALLSIHANDCRDYGEFVSGFLVARAAARPAGGFDDTLTECIGLHYGNQTGLGRRFSLTQDMTDYHTFREIHPLTPASIIELGFMKDDRPLLTEQQDLLADSIVAGIQCFLGGDDPYMQMTQQARSTETP